MANFSDFKIPSWLEDSLIQMGYTEPTPIQEQAIPSVLEGKDILGTAQTGTGKTGAFLIPLLAYLDNNLDETALIMAPTRELATQVHSVALNMLKTNRKIKTALLIGGDPISKQFFQLKQKPRLIVGTPGRINDHIIRKSVNLSRASFVVLDETDRMLDLGFGVQIDEIFNYTPEKKQTLLFSATLSKEILKLVDNYLVDPLRISAGEVNAVAANVTQEIIRSKHKYSELLKLLADLEGTVLVFVRTKTNADFLRNSLREEHYKAEAIHGGLRQIKRTSVLKNFRDKRFNILVATDVASRGLDIDHISFVINYDIPDNPEDYVHRIGRTARAGKEGASYSLVSPGEEIKWKAIQRFLNPDAHANERDFSDQRRNSKAKKNPFQKRSSEPFGNKNKPFNQWSRFDDNKANAPKNEIRKPRQHHRNDRFQDSNINTNYKNPHKETTINEKGSLDQIKKLFSIE